MPEPGLTRDFDIPGGIDLLLQFEKGQGPLYRIVAGRMLAMLDTLNNQAVGRTPVGVTGNLSAAWGVEPPQVRGRRPPQITGEVVNPLDYGPPIEDGRDPGSMPPPSELELWVKRKLGVPDDQVEGVAYVIARKIEAKGTKGAHMLRDAWDKVQPIWDQQFDLMLEELIEAMGDAL